MDEKEEYEFWQEKIEEAYNQGINEAIKTFKLNTFDSEVGNTYICKILEEFEKLKK